MSGVNNVTFSYQEYKAYVKNNKDFRLANRTYSMELGNSAGDGRVLANSSYRDTKTGASYRLTAAYDENFSTCAVAIWLGAAIKQQKYNSHILPSAL